MQNQKLEGVLNLSLEATGEEREKSRQLDVGYLEEEKRWELIREIQRKPAAAVWGSDTGRGTDCRLCDRDTTGISD